MDYLNYNNYFKEKRLELSSLEDESFDFAPEEIPLMPNQYCYTHNLLTNEFENVRGVKNILGFKDECFNLDLYYRKVHPDDLKVIFETTKKAYEFAERNSVLIPFTSVLTILFRIRNVHDKFIHVLRVSAVQNIENEQIVKTFSVCTDVSKLYLQNKLALDFNSDALEKFKSKDILNESKFEKLRFLTSREKAVLELIGLGYTSKDISEELSISLTTVHTHRRNIVKKMGSKNLYIVATELINK